MMQCKKCVLSEYRPDIWLKEEGVCNICADFKQARGVKTNNSLLLESELVKLLNKYRGKGKYDCLVMCSGGKDSTSSLYYMKKRYKMNPLAFTFDNGFETEEAMGNVKNAVEILGIEWLLFKSNFMKAMFTEVIKSKSKAVLCHLCSIWYMGLTFDIADKFDIPLIIGGWTMGQAELQSVIPSSTHYLAAPEYQSMAKATMDFLNCHFDKSSKYKNFPRSMKEVISKAQKKHKTIIISPHWFLQKEPEEHVETLKKELKWKYPKVSYPAQSTNCYLNFLSVHLSMKYYGYTHYHVEMSKMIRMGMLTRDKALKLLKKNYDEKLLASILKKLDCELEDL